MLRKSWFITKVTSTDGWSVQVGDRGTLVYREKKVRVWVGIEVLSPGHGWVVFSGDMRVGSIQGVQLTDEKLRLLILERIKAFFDFIKYKYEIR